MLRDRVTIILLGCRANFIDHRDVRSRILYVNSVGSFSERDKKKKKNWRSLVDHLHVSVVNTVRAYCSVLHRDILSDNVYGLKIMGFCF